MATTPASISREQELVRVMEENASLNLRVAALISDLELQQERCAHLEKALAASEAVQRELHVAVSAFTTPFLALQNALEALRPPSSAAVDEKESGPPATSGSMLPEATHAAPGSPHRVNGKALDIPAFLRHAPHGNIA